MNKLYNGKLRKLLGLAFCSYGNHQNSMKKNLLFADKLYISLYSVILTRNLTTAAIMVIMLFTIDYIVLLMKIDNNS